MSEAKDKPPQHRQLAAIVRKTTWLFEALQTARAVNPPDWLIGGGAIRDAVWDSLHGLFPRLPRDIDVAIFDAADTSAAVEQRWQHRLQRHRPDLPWEVINQAAVHLWFERLYGDPVEPLTSVEDALGTWPEPATCVGLRLDAKDQLSIIAPLGLDDLLSMTIRRNPRRVSLVTYRERIASKRYNDRWPRVWICG